MAIFQGVCNSFKAEVLGGIHDLDTDVLKLALYVETADLGPSTVTTYSTTDETVGTGYTAGGKTITGAVISLDGNVAIVDFDDVIWPNATITAAGALIYNSSKANRAVAIISFQGSKTSTEGDFGVIMPAADASNAVLQLV